MARIRRLFVFVGGALEKRVKEIHKLESGSKTKQILQRAIFLPPQVSCRRIYSTRFCRAASVDPLPSAGALYLAHGEANFRHSMEIPPANGRKCRHGVGGSNWRSS